MVFRLRVVAAVFSFFSKKVLFKYAATITVIIVAALIAININVNHKTLISFNTPKTNVYNEYSKDINTMFVEQDNSHLAEAGLPTDENGLLDLNGM